MAKLLSEAAMYVDPIVHPINNLSSHIPKLFICLMMKEFLGKEGGVISNQPTHLDYLVKAPQAHHRDDVGTHALPWACWAWAG